MRIDLSPSSFMTSPSLKDYLARRISFAFSFARNRIATVTVRLSDLNGPRGGRDKLCQVSVSIPGHAEIVVKDVEENFYAAVDCAVRKAAYRATQMLKRRRKQRQQGMKEARFAQPPLPALA
ncbi:MAG TPA: HPF/RaiA family ribosome-associated protein [Noviherbaspirillum sp.]|jgi:ribosome-associated translation inhibitor RaiA|uniref:HPF/RaiA family ribosome-associated protein n=1 Tax=Noviherbaspirillum sp. TaxID=1926288 RepID=UPI002F9297AA